MKASELRINQTYYLRGYVKTLQFSDFSDFSYLCDNLKPILLTEERLIKFGFEDWGKDKYGYTKYVLHNVIDGTSNFGVDFQDGEECCPVVDEELCAWGEFKYVHQLQNLYFALTGEDLAYEDN